MRRERTLFFAESYLGMKGDALSQLMDLAADVQAEYEALKAEKSLLDNDDLLTRAYDALKDNPLVHAEFAGKFKMVMVDEFQDTAQQQVELVRLLCGADGRELFAPWAMPSSPSTGSAGRTSRSFAARRRKPSAPAKA